MLKAFFKKFSNDWSMNMAGMLTYSLLTTIFPLLLALLTIFGLVLHFIPLASRSTFETALSHALPQQASGIIDVHALVSNVINITGPLAIVSLVGLVWGGSNLFSTMENAFGVIFRTKGRDFLPQRLMALGMVVILGILLPISLGASSLVTAGSHSLQKVLPPPTGLVLSWVGPIVSLVVLWLLFLIIYIVVPNIKVPFRHAWRGAVAAAILFAILSVLFPLYFKFFLSGNAKYGQGALSVLVLVVWLWFFSLITIIGAQINALAMGIKPTDYDMARVWARDYREHLVQADRQHVPPARAGPGRRERLRTVAAHALGTLASLLVSLLRLAALAVWLVARRLMRETARESSDA